MKCQIFMQSCDPIRRNKVYEECMKSDHMKQKFHKCEACLSNFRRELQTKCQCSSDDPDRENLPRTQTTEGYHCDAPVHDVGGRLPQAQTIHKEEGSTYQDKSAIKCKKCFYRIESKIRCDHVKTLPISQLKCSGYAFTVRVQDLLNYLLILTLLQLFDNYKNKIVYESEYFKTSNQNKEPIKHFMDSLNEHIM